MIESDIDNHNIIKKRNKKEIDDNNKNNNDTNNNKIIEEKPIVLKKKRHPLITTLRYVAIFLIVFLLTSDYFIKFVEVEASSKFDPNIINPNTLDLNKLNQTKVAFSPNYYEVSSEYLYSLLKNKTYDVVNQNKEEKNKNSNKDNKKNNSNKENKDNNNNNSNLNTEETKNKEKIVIVDEKGEEIKNENNLEEVINQTNTYLLFLYHTSCPFSQRLLPIIETLSRTFPNITFYQAQGYAIFLKSHFHTRTTPTLFIHLNDTLIKYKGSKDYNSITKWISANSGGQPALPNIELNPNIEKAELFRPERGYMVYFSCFYVVFLILLSFYRIFKRIPKLKNE
ncbi:hypothetical protein DICPUDRAFT_80961 [Dictyostelium purpureum]|uniref:Thioredoxin domain-containing protein n=1 Tax=Dictyostelium purpureum TaxID=5786 RepID=F0ZS25_DICPU|nr:uncharacterized protein DICPUDRAFT_80961 [Dictyostelium purpureum]EGC33273.1 hypothetical protein DICPUDRAFT_80961 [Dictyostelium purpureum]|eukprot:XP_003290220.1 hypothetical protein DICPUDRAFT_80961 [Dictyostelium purpureum]